MEIVVEHGHITDCFGAGDLVTVLQGWWPFREEMVFVWKPMHLEKRRLGQPSLKHNFRQ